MGKSGMLHVVLFNVELHTRRVQIDVREFQSDVLDELIFPQTGIHVCFECLIHVRWQIYLIGL
jgi:hypothetical protein